MGGCNLEDTSWYQEPFLFGFTFSQIWVFLSPLIAGAVAAWLNDRLKRKSERQRKKEEWLGEQLADAFNLLCDALEHPGMPAAMVRERKLKLEKAINLMHLYGDQNIRKAADDIVSAYERGDDWILYAPLMKEIRDAFRKNIGLDPVQETVRTLKFSFQEADNAPQAEGEK